jgi:hypothetical protein
MWHAEAAPAALYGYNQAKVGRELTRDKARIEKGERFTVVSQDEEMYVRDTIVPNVTRPAGIPSGNVMIKLYVYVTTTVHDNVLGTDTITRKRVWSSAVIDGYGDTYKDPSSVVSNPPPDLPVDLP